MVALEVLKRNLFLNLARLLFMINFGIGFLLRSLALHSLALRARESAHLFECMCNLL